MLVQASNSPDPSGRPRWCSAILRDEQGRYLFERRSADAASAAGILNRFGGTREPDEEPEACLRRELIEELGLVVGTMDMCVELATPTGVGWYYRVHGAGPRDGEIRALEPGFGAEWVAPADFERAGVGSWNVVAIAGALRGHRFVRAA